MRCGDLYGAKMPQRSQVTRGKMPRAGIKGNALRLQTKGAQKMKKKKKKNYLYSFITISLRYKSNFRTGDFSSG